MTAVRSYLWHFDLRILHLLNQRLRCRELDVFMRIITYLGSAVFAVGLTLFLLLQKQDQLQLVGLQLAVVLILGQILVHTIKRVTNRPRPYMALEEVWAKRPPNCEYSFPSGHTCAAFSMAFVLCGADPGHAWFYLPAALLISASRTYLGFHYPTDLACGLVLAVLAYLSGLYIV